MKYYFKKIKRSIKDGTIFQKAYFFFYNSINVPIEVILGVLFSYKKIRKYKVVIDGSSKEMEHSSYDYSCCERIIGAYKYSNNKDIIIHPDLIIKGLWREWLDVNYYKLTSALNQNNKTFVLDLLSNMFQESFTRGFGMYENYISLKKPFGNLYFLYIWKKYLDHYLSSDGDLTQLYFPPVGHPSGVLLNNSVIPVETIRHSYFANQYIELLRDIENPTIVEIGGGFGGFCFQFLSRMNEKKSKYIIYDLPEVNSISSYFLMKSFPNKKFLLFGEGNPYDSDCEDFDIAIMPYFSILEIPSLSVDLFYNACSFSEMSGETSSKYLKQIELSSKKYFSHENHDIRFTYVIDGMKSQNMLGSELLPDPSLFKRVYKKPRVYGLPQDKLYKSYEYLYERI